MSKNFDVQKNNEAIQEFIAGRSLGEIYSDNEHEVVRSYVTESKYNKGMFVQVLVCRNGKKYVVAGEHHSPTYLKEYSASSDINGKH